VLVTVDHRDGGRQHVWEGFPGRPGDFTAYLFHYARTGSLGPTPLLSLYGRFFRTRHRYKRGDAELARLTYGIIPGWTRLTPAPALPERLLLVGDAAARHSPLTFCGFGSMVRSFAVIGDGLIAALADGDLSSRRLSSLAPEPELLRGVGGLALLLAEAHRREPADATNRLLDAAFRSLFEAGDRAYGRFLRDEARLVDLVSFMWTTSRRRPSVYRDLAAHLSPSELARWARVAVSPRP
jgi:lycopene cyclase CruA